jgi:general secretion pathway protein J
VTPPTDGFPKRGSRARSAGFTLVELLVGLSLLALLSVLLFGGFRFGLRAWESGDQQIHAIGEVERAQGLIRTLLSEAQPPAAIAENGTVQIVASFAGTSDGISFIAPLPAHHGVGGLYEFRLAVDRSGERESLVLSWRSFRLDRRLGEGPDFSDSAILLPAAEGASFAYYGKASDDRPLSWLTSWNGERGLPQLVRLQIEGVGHREKAWPELVAALKLQ